MAPVRLVVSVCLLASVAAAEPPPRAEALAAFLDRMARETGMQVVYEGARPSEVIAVPQGPLTPAQTVIRALEGLGIGFAASLDGSGTRVSRLVVFGRGSGGVRAAPPSSAPSPPGPSPMDVLGTGRAPTFALPRGPSGADASEVPADDEPGPPDKGPGPPGQRPVPAFAGPASFGPTMPGQASGSGPFGSGPVPGPALAPVAGAGSGALPFGGFPGAGSGPVPGGSSGPGIGSSGSPVPGATPPPVLDSPVPGGQPPPEIRNNPVG